MFSDNQLAKLAEVSGLEAIADCIVCRNTIEDMAEAMTIDHEKAQGFAHPDCHAVFHKALEARKSNKGERRLDRYTDQNFPSRLAEAKEAQKVMDNHVIMAILPDKPAKNVTGREKCCLCEQRVVASHKRTMRGYCQGEHVFAHRDCMFMEQTKDPSLSIMMFWENLGFVFNASERAKIFSVHAMVKIMTERTLRAEHGMTVKLVQPKKTVAEDQIFPEGELELVDGPETTIDQASPQKRDRTWGIFGAIEEAKGNKEYEGFAERVAAQSQEAYTGEPIKTPEQKEADLQAMRAAAKAMEDIL
jgi:hypothetical protein